MTYLRELISKKDKRIFLYHQEKNIEALESVLDELNEEHTMLKKNMNDVVYLLELVDEHHIKNQKKKTINTSEEPKHISLWLQSLKGIFESLHTTLKEDLNSDDIDFLKLEIPKLIDKKENLGRQIKYLNNIIAKTTVLLMNLRNELCKEITKGHDITAITRIMAAEFGEKVVGSYTSGRKEIIKFLEKYFEINKVRSKELIDLLEKSKAINFKIDIPENDVFYYYKDYGFADEFVPIIGAWNITY